jgi:hypothetical protein
MMSRNWRELISKGAIMAGTLSRREMMKGALTTAAGLAALNLPLWALPPLAQGKTPVVFTDFPQILMQTPEPGRAFSIPELSTNFITPADQYYTFQHFAQPMIDPATLN